MEVSLVESLVTVLPAFAVFFNLHPWRLSGLEHALRKGGRVLSPNGGVAMLSSVLRSEFGLRTEIWRIKSNSYRLRTKITPRHRRY